MDKAKENLKKLLERISERTSHLAGYPCNSIFDYSEIFPFLKFPVNNIGDPYQSSNYQINSHELEREVISTFCDLTKADKENTWGYVTNGGTEGNLYGMYLARELYPSGIVYYSEETHYSATKIMRLLQIRSMMMRTLPNGEIDYDDLKETIRIHRDCPPLIFANIGTTMKGAVDNIEKIKKIMKDLSIKQFYIHADAALSGFILPFVSRPQPFDFSAGIDSISISGHKMIGSPIPCGIVLAKKGNVNRIARSVEYVGSLDTTLTGSRNGITPIFLWYALQKMGIDGMKEQIATCMETADYTIKELKKIGLKAWRNENSITVVFPRPGESVVKNWQLAVENENAHIITMPHITPKIIDYLIKDILSEGNLSDEKNNYNHG